MEKHFVLSLTFILLLIYLFPLSIYANENYEKELLLSYSSIYDEEAKYNISNKEKQNARLQYYEDNKVTTISGDKTTILQTYPSGSEIGTISSPDSAILNKITFSSSVSDCSIEKSINYSLKGTDNMIGFKSGAVLFNNKNGLIDILDMQAGDIFYIKTEYGEFRYKIAKIYQANYDSKHNLIDGSGKNVLTKFSNSYELKIVSNIPNSEKMFCVECELVKGTKIK